MQQDQDVQGQRAHGRPARWQRRTAAAVLLILTLWLLAAAAGYGGAWLEERQLTRSAENGIAEGARAKTLGPEDSPRAVLFVHGYVGGGNNFASLPEQVAGKGWRVRVMRLPGHGVSPRELAHVSHQALIEAVREEARALREKHDVLVLAGHSMGAALSVLTAARDGADALVLGAPYFGVSHRWYYGLRPETWARLTSRLIPYVLKAKPLLQVANPEVRSQIYSYRWAPTASIRELMQLGQQVNEPRILRAIDCPVLHLHSESDFAASPEAARTALDQMVHAEVRSVWLEQSNHHIFWDYDREQVTKEVLEFLEQFE